MCTLSLLHSNLNRVKVLKAGQIINTMIGGNKITGPYSKKIGILEITVYMVHYFKITMKLNMISLIIILDVCTLLLLYININRVELLRAGKINSIMIGGK